MKNKYTLLIAFIFVAAAQIYIPVSMIAEREDIIKTGKIFKFRTAPIDPNDPFRGKYVILSFDQTTFKTIDSLQFNRGDDIFVLLSENHEGFAEIENLSLEAPSGAIDYVKAKIGYIGTYNDTTSITINYPFDRYYMEEYKALEAEEIYTESQLDFNTITYAQVKIKDGEAVLEDVMIDGVSIKDLVESKNKE